MLKQFNATYVRSEDRVLLRFTTDAAEEYRFWLTRAAFLELRAAGGIRVEERVAAQVSAIALDTVVEFQRENAQRSANFGEAFEPASRLPLGADPTLIAHIDVQRDGDRYDVLLGLVRGSLTLHLNENLLQQLLALIEGICAQNSWLTVEKSSHSHAAPLAAPPSSIH